MRKSFIMILLFIIVMQLGCASEKTEEEYLELWQEVKVNEKKGLPKSTLKILDKIYKKSKQEKNNEQIIKSLIKKTYYIDKVEEDSFQKINDMLIAEINEIESPAQNVIHSILAQVQWSYYKNNLYKISDSDYDINDETILEKMTRRQLIETIIENFDKSLENSESLKDIKSEEYSEILRNLNSNGKNLRPSLYDILVHAAIDFYSDNRANLTRPVYEFYINDTGYFSNVDEFVKYKIKSKDTNSFNYNAVRLFQDLLRDYHENSNEKVLFDVDIKRMKFIYNKSVLADKEKEYERSLQNMLKNYRDKEAKAELYYELAKLYIKLGNQWSPGGSEKYRLYKQKAYETCLKAEKECKGAIFEKNCKTLKNEEILNKSLAVKTEKIEKVDSPIKLLVEYQNIEKVKLKLVKIPETEKIEKYKNLNRYISKNYKKYMHNNKNLVREEILDLPKTDDFQRHSTEIVVDKLNSGFYALIIADKEKTSDILAVNTFQVSDIAYLERYKENGAKEFYILNRKTGIAIPDCEIQVWYKEYNKIFRKYVYKKGEVFKTDENGYIVIEKNNLRESNFELEINYNNDRVYISDNYTSQRKQNNIEQAQTYFFTDRAIYRPGQILYFKGLSFEKNSLEPEKNRVLAERNHTVFLYDANGRIISEKQYKSNEFGTFNGNFVIPENTLNGEMRISDGTGNRYIRVEEYKRPKFEVLLDNLSEEYVLEETINVNGNVKMYSGASISDARIRYRVERKVFFPYSRYSYHDNTSKATTIKLGTSKTDDEGKFKIKFTANPDKTIAKESKPVFTYTIYVDAVDDTGETISSTKNISVAYDSAKLSINTDDAIDKAKEKLKIALSAQTYNGVEIAPDGRVSIYRLQNTKKAYRERLWSKPDKTSMTKEEYEKYFPKDMYDDKERLENRNREQKVFEKKVNKNNRVVEIKNISDWVEGQYVIEYEIKDKYGKSIKTEAYITVFSTKSNKAPYKTVFWHHIADEAKVGETLDIMLGTSEQDVWGVYEVEYRNSVLERKIIKLNNEQKVIKLAIKEKYRGNISIRYNFVKDNRAYNMDKTIIIPWDNKKLDIKFEKFRTKLLPGENEEWIIKVQGKNKGIDAEMAAVVYDASLDAFTKNTWEKNGFYSKFHASNNWDIYRAFGLSQSQMYGGNYSVRYINKSYPKIDYDYHTVGYGMHMMKSTERSAGKAMMRGEELMYAAEAEADTQVKQNTQSDEIKSEEEQMKDIKIRENFDETAFFYPELRTDKEGTIKIVFQMPDTLSKWKMLGFANTKNLDYGFIEKEFQTAKDFFLKTNNPRFLRVGDKIVYSVKIQNDLDEKVSGRAKLEIFDAYTMKDISEKIVKDNLQLKHTIDAKSSKNIQWTIEVPKDYDMLLVRVKASGNNYSDGEETVIPVLKNKIMVTDTLPLPVRENEKKHFKFQNLIEGEQSNTIENYKLTFEYTANPVWYVVQALPYLMEQGHENMDAVFSRYYANVLAKKILDENPKIEKIYKLWKADPNSKELTSKLEKNQELKSILLEESPWLMAGKNESERKQKIAMLFDKNRLNRELEKALKKLEDGQMPSGAWPWFEGMKESRYITQYILSGMARLEGNKIENTDIYMMAKNAIKYLDEVLEKDYVNLKESKVNMSKVKPNHTPEEMMKNGMGFLPEDRKQEGIFLDMSVKDNVIAASLDKSSNNKITMNDKKARENTLNMVKKMNIKVGNIEDLALSLSGGNQQKLLIARWLLVNPRVLIVDEPTRGIDVGAKQEVYYILRELAKQGMGIIVISSELPEIIGLSDRIITLYKGKITGTLSIKEVTEEKIGTLIMGL